MKKLISVENVKDVVSMEKDVISMEEGYKLVYESVKTLWRRDCFRTLTTKVELELDEIVSEVYITLLNRDFFNKYNSNAGASKKTYVYRGSKNVMIDMSRTYKETYSLDMQVLDDSENSTLGNKLEDNRDLYAEYMSESTVKEILNVLDGDDDIKTTFKGFSPILGECKPSPRVVAIHLIEGYTFAEIASFFYKEVVNKTTGEVERKSCSNSYINKIVRNLRVDLEYVVPYLTAM